MDVLTIYPGSDMLLELKGLLDKSTGEYVQTATVEMTLLDSAGADVTGQTWPLAMSLVEGTNGVYRASLASTLDVTAGQRYVASIDADGGTGLVAHWDVDVIARTRRR